MCSTSGVARVETLTSGSRRGSGSTSRWVSLPAGLRISTRWLTADIAATSIEQASERYNKLRPRPFDGFFFAYDCFSVSSRSCLLLSPSATTSLTPAIRIELTRQNPIDRILPPQLAVQNLYDNVTMQFCMHYAFETAAKARMMVENVSRYLRPGGVFIGTIPDSDLLLWVFPRLRTTYRC